MNSCFFRRNSKFIRNVRLLLVFIVFSMLSGCIDVDDFGSYWDMATPDKALIGHWECAEGCEIATKADVQEVDGKDYLLVDYYSGPEEEHERMYVKTYREDDVGFLLVREVKDVEEGSKKGNLFYYSRSGEDVLFHVIQDEGAPTSLEGVLDQAKLKDLVRQYTERSSENVIRFTKSKH